MATSPHLSVVDPDAVPDQAAGGPDIDELVDALRREAESADSEWERIRPLQDDAHNYYEAKLFGNEVDGRSQIILPDVQETIDYMVPSVLRTFISGDRVVEFEATDEADEPLADEATAAIGYSFMRDQDGFRVLHDWLSSGLLEKYGAVKTSVRSEERVVRDRLVVSDPVELEALDGEVEDAEETEQGLVVSIKREITRKRFVDEVIPREEFRYSARARHEDDADYLAHVSVKTRSDLVDMGFDREQVYALPMHSASPDDREWDRDGWEPDPESTTALQLVQLREEYARMDLDGDGIAERVQVFRVENEILRWAETGEDAIETIDEQPFSVFTPFPRANRLIGYSLADKVMDIQLARSTIARQLMDGMYQANSPRPIISEQGASENTMDDVLSMVAGAPIRVRDASAIQAYPVSFDIGKAMGVMEWLVGERESRTGITRLNQGLDADALNKTATGTAMMQAQGQQQEEFIARTFAEAFSRLMAKKYRLMRREGEPFKIKVDGQYKQVDPRAWPEDVNVAIRVGLGTGSKDKRVQARMALAPLLAEGAAAGKVSDKNLYNAMDGLVRDLGLGQGSDFWKDPDAPQEEQQEQEQPDPEMLAMQAEQQREQQKMQFEQEKAAAQLQLQREKDAASLQSDRERHALEMEQRREAAALEAQLARDKASAEADIAIYRIDREAEVKRYAAEKAGEKDDGNIGQNREGGRLDA